MKLIISVFLAIIFFNIGTARSEELEVKTFQIRSASPETLVSVVEDMKSKEGKVVYDKRTNSLIVIDTPKKLEAITEVVEKIDLRLKQLQIKVTIADVSQNFLKDAGIKRANAVISPSRLDAVLNLLEQRNDSSIRSESMVTTLSNHPARVQVTSDIIIGERVVIYDTDRRVVSPVTDEVGSILEVLPRVNNDNTITLRVEPTLSNVQDSSNLPLKRSLFTNVVINDGDTVVIGGVDSQKQTEQEQAALGIPLSRTESREPRETIIFLTAKIMK